MVVGRTYRRAAERQGSLSDRASHPQKSRRRNARKRPAGRAGMAARGGFAGHERIFRGAGHQRETRARRSGSGGALYREGQRAIWFAFEVEPGGSAALGRKRRELAGAGISGELFGSALAADFFAGQSVQR